MVDGTQKCLLCFKLLDACGDFGVRKWECFSCNIFYALWNIILNASRIKHPILLHSFIVVYCGDKWHPLFQCFVHAFLYWSCVLYSLFHSAVNKDECCNFIFTLKQTPCRNTSLNYYNSLTIGVSLSIASVCWYCNCCEWHLYVKVSVLNKYLFHYRFRM